MQVSMERIWAKIGQLQMEVDLLNEQLGACQEVNARLVEQIKGEEDRDDPRDPSDSAL